MTEEEKKKGLTKEISFAELAGDMIAYKPKHVRAREQIRDDDPYFRTIDAGHDLLMRGKRCKDLVDRLPTSLNSMILELEAIMKELTLSAMEDEFDYRTQMNRYYFHMVRINYLASLVSFQLSRFIKDRTAVQKYLGDLPRDRMRGFSTDLRMIAQIGDELALASTMFMDHVEADFELSQDMLEKRAMSAEQVLTLRREP